MQPTLNPDENGTPRHEWVFVNKIGHHSYNYHHGDIVMLQYKSFVERSYCRSPSNPKRYLVKRIIGLPGDWIQLKNNKLVKKRTFPLNHQIEVEKGHCWIEGDNGNNSIDSYSFGQVFVFFVFFSDYFQIPLALLEGKVKYVLFPFHSIRSLPYRDSTLSRVIVKEKDVRE